MTKPICTGLFTLTLSSVLCVPLTGANPIAPTAAPLSIEAKAARETKASALDNPAIDMQAYLRVSQEAAQHRATRRVSEEDFIRMSREPGTLVLDARSREKFDELHVKGAVSLAFSDIAIESLKRAVPDKNTRILIYCNNNFAEAEQPFPSKLARASLNLSTYIALYSYGYHNVYELAPLVELSKSKLPFESTPAKKVSSR